MVVAATEYRKAIRLWPPPLIIVIMLGPPIDPIKTADLSAGGAQLDLQHISFIRNQSGSLASETKAFDRHTIEI
jgi:hypothetical protein